MIFSSSLAQCRFGDGGGEPVKSIGLRFDMFVNCEECVGQLKARWVGLTKPGITLYDWLNKSKMKPLTGSKFLADVWWKAFLLNSLANMVIIVFSIAVKDAFDSAFGSENTGSLPLTMLFTFVASMLTYLLLRGLFGFGGGMMIT